MQEWKTGNPKENGKYIVTDGSGFVRILSYAKDLYKINEYDFYDKKGKSGWYFYDSEYGFVEWGNNDVIAYMKPPKPYKKEVSE